MHVLAFFRLLFLVFRLFLPRCLFFSCKTIFSSSIKCLHFKYTLISQLYIAKVIDGVNKMLKVYYQKEKGRKLENEENWLCSGTLKQQRLSLFKILTVVLQISLCFKCIPVDYIIKFFFIDFAYKHKS